MAKYVMYFFAGVITGIIVRFIKNRIKSSKFKNKFIAAVARKICEHEYEISGVSDSVIWFKCVHCGEEKSICCPSAPDELLKYGYNWYHQGAANCPETINWIKTHHVEKDANDSNKQNF